MPKVLKALIVDDEVSICRAIEMILTKEGYSVTTANAGNAALSHIYENEFDIVFTDLKLPDMNGLDIVAKAREHAHQPQVIVITGFASIETAIEAIRRGAYDYLTKPLSPEKVRITARRAMEKVSLTHEIDHLKQEVSSIFGFANLIGKSRKMAEIFKIISYASKSDSSVLVTGDSGTGKELVARAIHYNSPRKDMQFVPVNCGAISRELIESELFGYVKGAFTGAIKNKTGIFETASGGTVFLDEIGETSSEFQVKLLRVVQEGQFNKVGDPLQTKVDLRIVAATNRNLKDAVSKGEFREDLYYRLNVVSLHMPALRERKEDIPLLAAHFLEKHIKRHPEKSVKGFTQSALECLTRYDFPGNVRELENAVEHALVFALDERITPDELPSSIRGDISDVKPETTHVTSATSITSVTSITSMSPETPVISMLPTMSPLESRKLKDAKYEFERNLIISVLEECDGNISRAARVLDIHRQSLQQKLREFNIVSKKEVS